MVTVLIPWRGGCPHRERNLRRVLGFYAIHHPTWQLVVSESTPGRWVKAHAVSAALAAADDVIVLADADVWCDGIDQAAQLVADGAPWAVPHTELRRLDEPSTEAWTAGNRDGLRYAEPPYEGQAGGGIVAIRRDVYEACPLDPRFEGWGNEDTAWSYALTCLYGRPQRLGNVMWHLWHPPQERPDRVHGWPEGRELRRRYYHARKDPAAMRSLIEEAKAHDRSRHRR